MHIMLAVARKDQDKESPRAKLELENECEMRPLAGILFAIIWGAQVGTRCQMNTQVR